jgi:hypothetical protein
MKGLSFLSVVGFRIRFLTRSVQWLELVRREYQECGRKGKRLLRAGALSVMAGYSQLDHVRSLTGLSQNSPENALSGC